MTFYTIMEVWEGPDNMFPFLAAALEIRGGIRQLPT
jgi:hypothetical protein